ncbi:MAG: hypothetical protein ACRCYU_08150 [Nocardioides sp.]
MTPTAPITGARRRSATRWPVTWRVAAAVLLAALTLVGVHGAAAQASVPMIPGVDCKSPPTPGTNDLGPLAVLDPGPADPRTGDPFGPAASGPPSIYEAYGYAGLQWTNYDLGCGPDGARAPTATGWGMAADFMFLFLQIATGFVVAITRLAFNPDTLTLFDPIQRLAAHAFGDRVFQVLIWISLAVTGLWMLTKARKQRVPEATGTAGWAVSVVILGIAAVTWPLTIAPLIDKGVTGTVAAVNSALAQGGASTGADGVAANLHRAVLYETWRAGTFGRSSSPVADEYGPQLFAASGLTRQEATRTAGDPDARARLIEAKKNQFNDIADKIKDEDPQAYEYLAGRHNLERFFYAVIGFIGLLCAALFQVIAAFLMLYGLIAVRVAIMLIPIVALVAVHPRGRPYLFKILDFVGGALITAVFFGTVAAAFVAAIGGFLAPNPILAMVLLFIASLVLWKLTKPLRRLRGVNNLTARFRRLRDHLNQPDVTPADIQWSQTANTPDTTAGQPYEVTPRRQHLVKDAAAGAAEGAATTALLGASTGGTATLAAAATGAARRIGTRLLDRRREPSTNPPTNRPPDPAQPVADSGDHPLPRPRSHHTNHREDIPVFTPPPDNPTATPTHQPGRDTTPRRAAPDLSVYPLFIPPDTTAHPAPPCLSTPNTTGPR